MIGALLLVAASNLIVAVEINEAHGNSGGEKLTDLALAVSRIGVLAMIIEVLLYPTLLYSLAT